MDIFVGNLSFDATEGDVKKLFEGFGNVTSVVIVMEKEKKAPKSRGFGFVQMPDEQQALAAIAALNGKEFMGRVLNVNPARPKGQKAMVWPPIAKATSQKAVVGLPIAQATSQKAVVGLPIAQAKTEAHRESKLKKEARPKFEAGAEEYSREETEQKKTWFSPVFNKPGTYRGGRRTRSYISRRGLAGMQEEAKPRRRSQDNPMRWRKRGDQPKPWQRIPGEHKPWEKVEGGARPWKKAEGESKQREKPAGEAKSWDKSSERPQKSRFNSRGKPGRYKR